MSRYDNSTFRNKNGKWSYDTTIYKTVPEKDDDMYFISTAGDRCDNLAFRFYGDPNLWWFIARVNELKTMNIPPGKSLRIPTSTEKAKGF